MKRRTKFLAILMSMMLVASTATTTVALANTGDDVVVEMNETVACIDCDSDPCVCETPEDELEDEPAETTVCETCGEELCVCEDVPAEENIALTPYQQLMQMDNTEDMYLLILSLMENDPDALYAFTAEEITGLRTHIYALDPEVSSVDTQDMLDTLALLPNGEMADPSSVYSTLMAADSLAEMWTLMSAEENAEMVDTLTPGEIDDLTERVYAFYNAIYDEPTSADIYHYDSILDKFDKLLCNDVELYAVKNYTWSSGTVNFNGNRTVPSGDTYNVTITGNVTLSGTITVNGTLNITTDNKGEHTISRAGSYFVVGSNGKLVINGTDVSPITINGGSAGAPAISVDRGSCEFKYVNIKNYINTSAAGNIGSRGGAIRFGNESTNTANGTMDHVTIDACQAANGSAIMLTQKCTGTVTVSNSTIKNCRSNKTDWGGTIRTQGKYNGKLTVTSCLIENNYSSKNGGGIYWNACDSNAALKIEGTETKPTIIRGNSAGTQGGGLHLGGQTITITNTEISGNSAPNGGGISMTPYDDGTTISSGCNVTMGNNAKILNNTATNNGGAVYMRIYSADPANGVDFSINVNEGAEIKGNKAKYGGAVALIQEKGTKLYDAFVNINGGTIGGTTADDVNHATVDGGAFYISRDYTNKNYKLEVNVKGGTVLGNKADRNGGAIYLTDTASSANVTVSGGTMQSNTAVNGGAAYVNGGSFTMSGGNLTGNTATTDGGAAYVTGTGAKFTMTGGTASGNSAVNGGAAYVNNGSFDMSGSAVMHSNTASSKGGAAYVTGGGFTMTGGTLGGAAGNGNTAKNGGAVYVDGGDFNMISGTMSYNEAIGTAEEAEDGTAGYGGAVYAAKSGSVGGNIVIGVNGCTGPDHGTTHTGNYTSLEHPTVSNNKAKFGGGFSVNGGSVAFYCGTVINNKTDSVGTGMNVFMQDGNIDHYMDGSSIGSDTNHGMVSTGGKLTVYFKEGDEDQYFMVELYYHANIEDASDASIDVVWEGKAPNGYYLNLPYCPTEWQDWQENEKLKFVGWTESPESIKSSTIRSTNHYNPIGTPVQMRDTTKDDDKNIMRFYAVWAPETSNISYSYVLSENENEEIKPYTDYTDGAKTYGYFDSTNEINIGTPNKPGYTFQKWIMYANYGKDMLDPADNQYNASDVKISNWGNDSLAAPSAPTTYGQLKNKLTNGGELKTIENGVLNTLQNFGDITLVAVFEPAYTDLVINKEGYTDTTVFTISGTADDKTIGELYFVTFIAPNETQAVLKQLPVGTYTITEENNWSWRDSGENVTATGVKEFTTSSNNVVITITDPSETAEITYKNLNTTNQWLSGDDYKLNRFGNLTNTVAEAEDE